MKDALGLLEVAGLLGAITASDAMVKAANVELIGIEKAKGHGWMTIKISGDVGAVEAAVQSGVAIAHDMNLYVAHKVIPRPGDGLVEAFTDDYTPTTTEDLTESSTAAQTKTKPIGAMDERVPLDEKAVEVLDEIVSKIIEPKSTKSSSGDKKADGTGKTQTIEEHPAPNVEAKKGTPKKSPKKKS